MTFSVLWTTIPGGLDPAAPSRVRLSLIASPAVQVPVANLGASALADWPARVRALGPLALQVQGQTALLPATIATAPPSTEVWQRLLPASTKVSRPVSGVRRLSTTPDETYVQAAASLEVIFADGPGGGGASASSGSEGLAARAITTLGALTHGDATGDARLAAALPAVARARGPVRLDRLGGTELADTVATLRRQGHEALAVALPLAAHVAALRGGTGAQPTGANGTNAAGPAPLDGINPIGAADVHQIVGLLLDHPVLAVAVGLRLDLTVAIPATGLDGVRLVRLVLADGTPLNGDLVRPQPWSKVRLDRTTGVFTMADAGEVRGGLLDLGAADPTRPYLVTSADVTGLSTHLASITPEAGTEVRLPVRRNAGLTLAQGNRPSQVVESAMDHAVALSAGADDVDDAPVLTAADVTTGYRIDVSDGGGAFRSVVKRRVRYRVGTGAAAVTLTSPVSEIPGSDEGKVQRAVAVQQPEGPNGVRKLRVGEEIGQWTGWSMAAPLPGRTVAAEPGNPNPTEPIGAQPIPGIPLTATVTAEPGSLPLLRYGRRYRLRGRSVYLGGISLPPGSADVSQVSPEHHYLRTEAVSSPTLVHRTRNTAGESQTRMVVRSTGDGTPIGGDSERHVAPPKTAVQNAEWHGAFDAAYGPDSPQRAAARAALLTVARREAGSFLDPAPGVSVVRNDPNRPPDVTLPVRRGDPLPNGAYPVHDVPLPTLPYLADLPVSGAAVAGLTPAPVLLPYAGTRPEVRPGRLVLHPSTGSATTTTIKTEQGRPVLHVELPPGAERTVALSSTIRGDRLDEFDLGPSPDPTLPTTGADPRLTPAVELTLVHAVQKPVTAPTFAAAPDPTVVESETGVPLSAQISCHRDSTARLDLVGEWTETVDTGSGPVRPTRRTVVAGSVDVPRGGGPVAFGTVHQFGDTAARTIDYHAVASTRFAEYFPGRAAGPAGQKAGPSVSVTIRNRALPPEPDVHGVVPTFRFTEAVTSPGGVPTVTRKRFGSGVRVLLKRRWNVTGDGEQLGVVVFSDTAAGNAVLAAKDGRLDLVSRWGSDPLEEITAAAVSHLTPGRFGRRDTATTKPIALLDAPAGGKSLTIAGHPVEFDPARDLWFSDVDLAITESPWPFVRLALVRYQPSSLSGLAVSKVVKTDFVQLPPNREAVFSRFGTFGVKVVVKGAPTRNSTFTVRQERRVHDPAAPGIDIFSDAGVSAGTPGWTVTDVTAGEVDLNVLRALVLSWTAPGSPPAEVVGDLRNGRVVVEEQQQGLAVTGPGADSRVVYTDTVDRSRLGIG